MRTAVLLNRDSTRYWCQGPAARGQDQNRIIADCRNLAQARPPHSPYQAANEQRTVPGNSLVSSWSPSLFARLLGNGDEGCLGGMSETGRDEMQCRELGLSARTTLDCAQVASGQWPVPPRARSAQRRQHGSTSSPLEWPS